MQPLQEASRPLVLAALFLALWPSSAFMTHNAARARVVYLRRGSLDPSSVPVQRAAQTAVSAFNYQQGSPSALRAPGRVKKASLKVIPGVGRKYYLQFATKNLQTGENLGTCYASVSYLKAKPKPKPAVEISCTPDQDINARMKQDKLLYIALTGKETPPTEPLKTLADYGSSFIAWELSTEDMSYTLTQIKNMEKDYFTPEFGFAVQLGDKWGKTFLHCYMHIVWRPGVTKQVNYHCSPEESTDGSGSGLGSSDEHFYGKENNF